MLVEPQDPLNVGAALRAVYNMGLRDLRLVEPCAADPVRMAITGLGLEEVARALPRFPTLAEALADGVLALAFTARPRHARRAVWHLEELGAVLSALEPGPGRVLLVFGREDRGLSNADLDHCHGVVCVDTDVDYPHSLNLAQAVLLAGYAVRRAALAPTTPPQRQRARPASGEALEGLYGQLEATLTALGFFKFAGARDSVMRTLRGLLSRAWPDEREVATVRGILSEVAAAIRGVRLG